MLILSEQQGLQIGMRKMPRIVQSSGVPRKFVRVGSTNSVEDRENGDLGAVAP